MLWPIWAKYFRFWWCHLLISLANILYFFSVPFSKPTLKVWHGWVITSLCTRAIISMLIYLIFFSIKGSHESLFQSQSAIEITSYHHIGNVEDDIDCDVLYVIIFINGLLNNWCGRCDFSQIINCLLGILGPEAQALFISCPVWQLNGLPKACCQIIRYGFRFTMPCVA